MTTPTNNSTLQSTYTTPATFGGIGVGGMLFVIFLVLKLAQVKPFAKWSYWRVTAPLWIPVVIVILLVLLTSVLMNR
ncbi:hypothetical protein C7N43_34645 [Sphingobacteriales bacterium UPWRP_1]|nr:hypothetical protein C7N43_34645 [Sphingobacteriales bacterium UPWRP_1]